MTGKEAEELSHEELLEAVRRLLRENEQLQKEIESRDRQLESQGREIERMRRLVDELQRKAKRQAAPFSKGDPKPEPKKCGRKAGADYGIKAYRSVPPRIDEEYDARLPRSCPCCGGEIEFLKVERQFQAEVPRKPIWRQFNIEIGKCSSCHHRVQGRHPLQTSQALGAAASQLGPNAQAVVVHLNKDAGAPYGKITRFFEAVFGISLSRGGAAQVILRAAERCEGTYRQILVVVRRSRVVYPDETGWRVAAILRWLWTFVTGSAVAYVIRDSRGGEVPEEVLGREYAGILGHDGWAPYDNLVNATHQQCLAHLLRRCREILEFATRGAVRFPRQVKALLQDALALRDRRDAGEISTHGLAVATGRLESRMDRLLMWKRTNEANERLAKHIDRHRDEVFTFLEHPEVEATNWPAEQAIRPAVVNRKVWGGNRTWEGAHAQEVLLSVLRTCAKQGRDGMEFLNRTLRADSPRKLPRLNWPAPALG